MCTELLLAIFYFSTILFVNYLLYQLINNYFKNILYLLKIKNIFKFSNKNNQYIFLFLFSYSKQSSKNLLFFKNFKKNYIKSDIPLIGNLYKYIFSQNLKKSEAFYFYLLKYQYLSNKNLLQ